MDFYTGTLFSFDVNLQNICDVCDGTGSADGKRHTCDQCNGSGARLVKRQLAPGMFQTFQTTCDKCGGKGTTFKQGCKTCSGHGVKKGIRKFDVDIKPGTPRDHIHSIAGQADHSPDYDAGDLKVNIKERAAGTYGYRRKFNDLFRTEPLTLKEAMLGGWKRELVFFDNDNVTISRKKGESVLNGEIEIIKEKGMPLFSDSQEFGNLIIEYVVIQPGGAKKKENYFRDEL